MTADQISVNATGSVNLGQVRAGATAVSANNIRGNFTVSALALSASFAEVGAIVGGVSDSSIFNRIRFGISGTYLVNGQDAIRVLQSSGRGLESQALAQLLNSILNGSLSSSGKGDSDKNEGGEGGRKSGTTVLIPGLLSQESPRSAASEQGVPGLNQRFPGLPNTALW